MMPGDLKKHGAEGANVAGELHAARREGVGCRRRRGAVNAYTGALNRDASPLGFVAGICGSGDAYTGCLRDDSRPKLGLECFEGGDSPGGAGEVRVAVEIGLVANLKTEQ